MPNFLKCSLCGEEWQTRSEYLKDENIRLIGYQSNFRELELGLFLFNHLNCKTTLALPANQFTDLYNGPVLEKRHTGTVQCPEYCLNQSILKACPTQCECSYVREVIQITNNGSDKE